MGRENKINNIQNTFRSIWRGLDTNLRMAVGGGIFLGVCAGFVSSFLTESATLPFLIGLISWSSLVFLAWAFTSAGDLIVNSFTGGNRVMDTRLVESKSLQERANRAKINGQFEEAVNLYQDAINTGKLRNPESAAYIIAEIYENELKDLKEALYWYRKVIFYSCKEKCADSIYTRESRLAIERIQEWLRPDSGDVLDALVDVKLLIEEQNFDAAQEKLKEMTMRYPQSADVNYLFAHFYLFQNNLGMATVELENALDKDPDHLLAHFFMGTTKQDLGNFLEAMEHLQDYIQRAESDPEEETRIEEAKERIQEMLTEMSGPYVN